MGSGRKDCARYSTPMKNLKAKLRQTYTFNYETELKLNMPPAATQQLKKAAILVPIILENDNYYLIVTKRAHHLQHHAGQLCFPGGRIEKQDNTPIAAALRESKEEIDLDPTCVEILSEQPAIATVTNYLVTPVIGLIQGTVKFKLDTNEVSDIFRIPLSYITNINHYELLQRVQHKEALTFLRLRYAEQEVIGLTARIMRRIAYCLTEIE
jgi:8-oxo-dGTP pyrophosphatase MutT (NUDIX family)